MDAAVPVVVPRDNINDDTVEIVEWLVQPGDEVEENQPLVEIETSKSTLHLSAPGSGFVQYDYQAGDHVEVGETICLVTKTNGTEVAKQLPSEPTENLRGNEDATHPTEPAITAASQNLPPASNAAARLTRQARQLVAEHGLDATVFSSQALVRSEDVVAYLEKSSKRPVKQDPIRRKEVEKSLPDSRNGVPIRVEDLPSHKRREATYLRAGVDDTLTSSVSVVCPTSGLRAAVANQPQIGDNTTAIILFETSRLLRKYPVFNAVHVEGRAGYYEQVNIGFAVDGGLGLKVPVIQQADQKSLLEIVDEMGELVVRYMNDELEVAHLNNGTFTLTDLSGEGAFAMHPLINRDQSAILGVGGEFRLGNLEDGLFQLVLSFDHQLSEGRTATKFLSELRDRLAGYEAAFQQERAETDDDRHCCRCLRTASELTRIEAFLVQSVEPLGLLCSHCLRGF